MRRLTWAVAVRLRDKCSFTWVSQISNLWKLTQFKSFIGECQKIDMSWCLLQIKFPRTLLPWNSDLFENMKQEWYNHRSHGVLEQKLICYLASGCLGHMTSREMLCLVTGSSTTCNTRANCSLVSRKYCWNCSEWRSNSMTRLRYVHCWFLLFKISWTHHRCLLFAFSLFCKTRFSRELPIALHLAFEDAWLEGSWEPFFCMFYTVIHERIRTYGYTHI